MLLFSVNWLCRTTAVYLISIFFIASPVFAEIVNSNAKQDLILRTGEDKGDLLLNPPRIKPRKTTANMDNSKQTVETRHSNKQSNQNLKVTKEIDDSSKPDKNYIDVYIGRCPFTANAVKEVKKFISEHNGYYVQYYGMKTDSNYKIEPEEIRGLEIYLPVDAHKYNIKSVPSFVFNINGSTYKVSGDIDLNDIYNEIISGKIKGEAKDGYTDLGIRGKECRAVLVNLTPRHLKESDKQLIAKEASSGPKITGIKKVSLPEKSEPELIDKRFINYSGIKKFIVFSESQTGWAKEMMKKEKVAGCCTDCSSLEDIGDLVQFCTKELVESLGVKSVPSVVNIN